MAAFDDHTHLKTQWEAACNEEDADQLWDIMQQGSAKTATLAEALDSSGTTAGFQVACRKGHLELMRELLALTGAWEVDVHAEDWDGPEAAFRGACCFRHSAILFELLSLTGHRAIPAQFWQQKKKFLTRAARGAVWVGTSTRHGRRAMLLMRYPGAGQA